MITKYIEEVETSVTKELKNIGYSFAGVRFLSTHLDDAYLFIIMGKKEGEKLFSTWIYNHERKNLFSGNYDMTLENSYDDFSNRK